MILPGLEQSLIFEWMIHKVQVFSCKPGTFWPSFQLQEQFWCLLCGHNNSLICFPGVGCSGQVKGCPAHTLTQHQLCDSQTSLFSCVLTPPPPFFFLTTLIVLFFYLQPKGTAHWWLLYSHCYQFQCDCYLENLCLTWHDWCHFIRHCWTLRTNFSHQKITSSPPVIC